MSGRLVREITFISEGLKSGYLKRILPSWISVSDSFFNALSHLREERRLAKSVVILIAILSMSLPFL